MAKLGKRTRAARAAFEGKENLSVEEAVSLIKAGAEIIGRPAGSVRAPLEMPSAEERVRLETLVETAKGL